MRTWLTRLMLATMIASVAGIAAPTSAWATGCDNEIAGIYYGDDVKPTDICLRIGPDLTTRLMINYFPDEITFNQNTCYLNVCQNTHGSIDLTGTRSDVGEYVCLGPNYCLFVDAWNDGKPHVQVCYVFSFGSSDCPVETRAPEDALRG